MTALATLLGTTGRSCMGALHVYLRVCALIADTLYWAFVQPFRGRGLRLRAAVEQFVEIGVRSLPIVGLICFLIGAIIAMQMASELARFGVLQYIANLVAVSAMRELAPLMTAILVTGRSGSAITAQIGSMKVAEEIDALDVMGVNATKFLVVPTFFGLLFALPCLTILAAAIMIAGGYCVAVYTLHVEPAVYIANAAEALSLRDLAAGLSKSVFFALVICWVGVYRGFQVSGGAEGVGKMTTASVVTAIFLIIAVDLVFTMLFFF